MVFYNTTISLELLSLSSVIATGLFHCDSSCVVTHVRCRIVWIGSVLSFVEMRRAWFYIVGLVPI